MVWIMTAALKSYELTQGARGNWRGQARIPCSRGEVKNKAPAIIMKKGGLQQLLGSYLAEF